MQGNFQQSSKIPRKRKEQHISKGNQLFFFSKRPNRNSTNPERNIICQTYMENVIKLLKKRSKKS